MARIKMSRAGRKSTRKEIPLKFRPLSLAVASALSMNAWAQVETDSQQGAQGSDIEEIVVTGFRGSLMEATRLKMESEQIIEAVSAEELGKLPDNSIADALSRLPGIAGQREPETGRQREISIRGLSGDFSTALLNGQSQVSAGDSRSVQFDQYPSELLARVVVYKTPSASLAGQGLSGTVDMQTVRPLDYGEPAIAGNVRYEWNDKPAASPDGDNTGQRFTLSYIDQFDNEKVGFALGYAGISAPTQGDEFGIWNYHNAVNRDSESPLVITGGAARAQTLVLNRDSVMGVLEFRPSERVTHAMDLFYSEFEQVNIQRVFSSPFGRNSLGPNPTVEGDRVVGGVFENVKLSINNTNNTTDAALHAASWTSEFALNDGWSAEFKLNQSVIGRDLTNIQTYSGTGPFRQGATDTLTFTVDDVGFPSFTGVLDYTAPGAVVLTAPLGWGMASGIPGGQVGYYNVRSIDDEISQVRAAAQRTLDVGGLSDIHFGVQYDQRGKEVDNTDSAFVGLADGSLSAPFESTGISQTPFGFPAISTYDAATMFNSGIYNLVYNQHSNVLANDYSVDEKLLMAFLEFGVDSTLFNVPVTGNFGVRIVNTDQSSSGTSIKHGNTQQNSGGNLVKVPYSDGDKYTDFLPSMNLNFQVAEDKVVRLGIARALARAAIDDMRASRTVQYNASKAQSTDINDAPWGGGGGNPLLRPWISNQVDLSYEHYFPETRGYWAVAAYYKDLETYIFNDELLVDFTGFPAEPPPFLNEGLVSRPQNGEGGELYGIEFSISIPGEMLTPTLTGFGAVFNASATESSVSTNPSVPDETRLPGLSEEVVNATLYYERYGFSARVSSTFRSDFLQRIQGLGGLNNRMVKAEQIVSAQVGYRFQSGSLAGLNVFLQGQNLTDRVRHVYFERDPRLANSFNLYGRTFLFGASYRL